VPVFTPLFRVGLDERPELVFACETDHVLDLLTIGDQDERRNTPNAVGSSELLVGVDVDL
jgi:hypothetical protein